MCRTRLRTGHSTSSKDKLKNRPQVNGVTGHCDAEAESEESFFIDTVDKCSTQSRKCKGKWMVQVQFNVDTGDECNNIPYHLSQQLTKDKLRRSKVKLVSYCGRKIPAYTVQYGVAEFQVIKKSVVCPLLGIDTCEEMEQIQY